MIFRHIFSRVSRFCNWSIPRPNIYTPTVRMARLHVCAEHSRFYSEKASRTGKGDKSALIIFAKGAEEMEVVISADVLRRSDIDVTIAGLCGKEPIKCNNNLVIIPDAGLEDVKKEKFDAIVLPGGWDNVQTMARSEEFGEFLREKETESYIATFCHGPIALAKHCIGKGKCITTCPNIYFLRSFYKYVDEKIVVDGNLITCEGPAAAFLFALKIVELLRNTKKAQEVADILLVDDYKEGRRNFGSFLKKPSIHGKPTLLRYLIDLIEISLIFFNILIYDITPSKLTMIIKPVFSYAIRYCSSSLQQINNYKTRSWARKLLANAELSRFYSEKKALNGKEPKSAVIIFANGAEEMEVAIPADVLRRAKVDVILAGLCDNKPVKCNQGLVIVPDCAMKDLENRKFDAIVLPGGLENNLAMAESDKFGEYLKKKEEESYIAAICSGPLALAAHCIGKGKRVTSYPKVKPDLESIYKYVDDEKVVVDGKLVTSQGPGTAFLFALKLVELLKDKQEAKEIAKLLLVDNYC
ncbi:uncharacterized protein ACN427_009627 [Glossina fuscipes fuscipes]